MTKDEFINAYMCVRSISTEYRTPDGVRSSTPYGMDRVAVPCACGAPECHGWRMIPREDADEYLADPENW